MEDRVERTYYADGTLRQEVHYRGKKEHGSWREWYPNGVLAKELWFQDGLYVNGVNRSWHENGRLQSEVTILNGREVGRMTVYKEDGSVMYRHYVLEDGKVSRSRYLEACRSRPELPRYDDESAGPPDKPSGRPGQGAAARRRTTSALARESKELAEHEAFVKRMLSGRIAEAREWLRGAQTDRNAAGEASLRASIRSVGGLAPVSSKDLVDELYHLGAARVFAVEIEDIPGTSDQTTSHLLVQVPRDPSSRARLFAFERQHSENDGLDGTIDRGQEYLYIKLC